MTVALMQAQAPGINVSDVVLSTDKLAYCIDDVNGSKEAYYIGGDQNVNGDNNGFGTDTGTDAAVTTGSTCADVVSG